MWVFTLIFFSYLFYRIIVISWSVYLLYFSAKQLPQGILLLGGDVERERYLVELTRNLTDKNLDIWVSSGCWRPNHPAFDHLLSSTSPYRLHVDSRAIDTVTNFTTLLSDIKTAKTGKIIFSIGNGISLTPMSPPISTETQNRSQNQEGKSYPEEHFLRILRDCVRSILFIFTGFDCAFLSKIRHPKRWKRSKELMKAQS